MLTPVKLSVSAVLSCRMMMRPLTGELELGGACGRERREETQEVEEEEKEMEGSLLHLLGGTLTEMRLVTVILKSGTIPT